MTMQALFLASAILLWHAAEILYMCVLSTHNVEKTCTQVEINQRDFAASSWIFISKIDSVCCLLCTCGGKECSDSLVPFPWFLYWGTRSFPDLAFAPLVQVSTGKKSQIMSLLLLK